MLATLKSFLENPKTELAITVLVIVNAIILGLDTSPAARALLGPALSYADSVILGVFVVEIVARIVVHRWRFFLDPWSLFDFCVVGIALVPSTGNLSVLRAFRVLRVLRIVSVIPALRRVVGGLVAALPGMGSIILLMGLIFYVFSVMATRLYGDAFPQWFGSIGESAYSLFQIMTLESWSMGIVRPVMEKFPNAWAFFVPFILSTTFTVLNLFIGIIVAAMQEEHDKLAEAEREAIHEETGNLVAEVQAMRRELVELRADLTRKT